MARRHGMFRRSVLVAACVGAGLATGGAVAVHALASGNPTPPSAPQVVMRNPAQARNDAIHAAMARPHIAATNASCGQTVTANLTLNGDLLCNSGVGLIVSGSSVVLNLNGHSVMNTGTGTVGIVVSGSHDTVEKGSVDYWTHEGVGVGSLLSDFAPVSNTITSVYVNFAGDVGIDDGGLTTTISSSTVIYSGYSQPVGAGYGISSHGTGGIYKSDHEVSNGGDGLYLTGSNTTVTNNVADANASVDTTNNVVAGTGIADNGGVGITLTGNVTDNNGVVGIWTNYAASNPDGGGNKAKGNGWVTHEPGYTSNGLGGAYGQNDAQCEGVVCS